MCVYWILNYRSLQAFLPLLEKASQAGSSGPVGLGRAVVLQMSTNMGSVGDNTSGGAYGYRISKVYFYFY